MIEVVLPPDVASVDVFGDVGHARLHEAERVVMDRAVAKRRREFITTRFCAREALSQLGVCAGPLLPGPGGSPVWPDGFIGSMTHCEDYRAAAVTRSVRYASIGVDAEPNERMPVGVLPAVALPSEMVWCADQPDSRVCRDRLLFSAKEAIYKAWYPLTGLWLEFQQVNLTFCDYERTFDGRFLVPGPTVADKRLAGFSGRWFAAEGLILTAVVIRNDQ